MFSVSGVRNACPRCNLAAASQASARSSLLPRFAHQRPLSFAQAQARSSISQRSFARSFHVSKAFQESESAPESPNAASNSASDVEKIVRDAKQRFRDTLPKGYLNEEEYALYERLYGPPLRETRPEDVGIDTHADMGPRPPRPTNEGTVLRQLEGGDFEELIYEIKQKLATDELPDAAEMAPEMVPETVPEMVPEISPDAEAQAIAERPAGYVDTIARSQREREALQRLVQDFEAAQKELQEAERKAVEEEEAEADELTEGNEAAEAAATEWLPEEDNELEDYDEVGDETGAEAGIHKRYHPYTLDGKYHDSPVEMLLPQEELVQPIRKLLDRTHHSHVKKAAESAFGGSGLPTSPATPAWKKNGNMGGIGLPPDQRHMTEIEADAFLAAYLPPSYASVLSILREVRRRVGSDWLQSRLKNGKEKEFSMLDAGAGGAGLIAWDQVLRAEWDVLKEKGEATGPRPIGRRSVIVGSERLRDRLKTFLSDTTFLPRLPDYEHSGETRGEHLDAGDKPQPRKSYDIIIASHLFLKEKQDHYRQAVLNNLWSLLKPDGGILIVIEKAHPRGFEAVAHVRDTLLKQFLLPRSGEPRIETEDVNASPAFRRELEPGHIIAPCTNHQKCPMYQETGKGTGRKDFCHFSQRFVRPPFYWQTIGNADSQGEVTFSYVAIQRGVANDSHLAGQAASLAAFEGYEKSAEAPAMQSLPRLVLPPLKRKGHVTLDLCTPSARIERWTVPKSFSKLAYHDARKSRWGDLWALGAKSRTERNIRAGKGKEEITRENAEKNKKSVRKNKRNEEEAKSGEMKNKPARGAQKRDRLREYISAQEAAEEEELGEIMDEEILGELEREEAEEMRKRGGN